MNKLKGVQGFEDYYSHLYGERWQSLKHALQQEPRYTEWMPKNEKIAEQKPYFLDAGSVFVGYTLPLTGAKHILDMCAAPGGKSLILAHRMAGDAQLLCNERSASRRNRLSSVLKNHLDEDTRLRIHIGAKDGALMCLRETENFDAILLDAPCSSERHVLGDKKYLNEWTSARIKHLAIHQWALLSSAFRLLKNDGYLVYCTCALSPHENDDVIKRLLKKFDTVQLQTIDIKAIHTQCSRELPDCEKTEYGYRILPDVQNGAGPLYFSLIKKGNF